VTTVASPIPVYFLIELIAVFGVGLPIGLLLKRRLLDIITLLLLVALIGGVALDLIIYNQLVIWCYNLERWPLNVSCSNFLPDILATIPISIIGVVVMIVYITKYWG
jgi:hypothetical protein